MLRLIFRKRIQSIIKKYGRGYYRATFLFPRSIREATWIYYTFVRMPDEIVDGAAVTDRESKLTAWINDWNKALEIGSDNETFTAFKDVMHQYNIPKAYADDFLIAMKQDLTVSRYQTYTELESYMYGSAVVVGYTMSCIIGYSDGALSHARALGEAFQMTNFLRDIREDYEERGRIYLPIEDMQRFGVTEDHIKQHRADDAWRALMKYQIERTRALYKYGVAGINLLNPRGRRAVYAAALIYNDILDLIEKHDYDVFSTRAVVSPIRKSMLLCKALWNKNR